MRRLWQLLLSIQLSMALSLSAQPDVHQQLRAAAALASRGQFEEASDLVRSALDSAQSAQLTQTERGRGLTLLGMAFQNQGEFQQAMSAYENALRVLEDRNEDAADYASALSAFGTLFRDMRQFDAATQMEMRALHVSQQVNDHAGIAVACANLADLELGLKHTKRAQAWLDRAIQESKVAPTLGDDFYAFVASSQAWLTELKGNAHAAAAGFEKEIGYLTQLYGEENPQVGWAYMLLGNAYLKNGSISDALSNMRKGCSVLLQSVGARNPRYLLAQVAYAQALDAAGMHALAVQTKTAAEQKLKVIYKEQCTECRITALALH